VSVRGYCSQTSVAQGGRLDLHLADDGGGDDATVDVRRVVTGETVRTLTVHVDPHPVPADPSLDHQWPVTVRLPVSAAWPSGLYRIDLSPGDDDAGPLFVVTPANPGRDADIVVAVPFPTYHAYAYMGGTPGASVYWNEQPERARRVSVRRPFSVDMQWEEPILRWLADSDLPVEYCSGYDLDGGRALLEHYRLLVCVGHDEYWSAGMRDTVEGWVGEGGNVAFLTGNTCWWQFRLEDGGRTFVCYRDAAEDPMTGVRDDLVTVEWGSAPVSRPENRLLGVSFRHGAGCWNDLGKMTAAAWTARFADHWVFDGTALADGARFGQGTVGYETDAAETVDESGVPRVTGRDGTPPDFVVLADASLGDWRSAGQGGAATMGVFRSPGGGTVFNAATTGWGRGLIPDGGAGADPVVERITRNVLERLSGGPDGGWELVGRAEDVTAMVACENRLYAADTGGALWSRDPGPQNLLWTDEGPAAGVRALASPREATGGEPIALYALAGGELLRRDPTPGASWTRRRGAPGLDALAMSYQSYFAISSAGDMVAVTIGDPAGNWSRVGDGGGVTVLTNLNGRLFGAGDGTLSTWAPAAGAWEVVTDLPGEAVALAGHAGWLYLATGDALLYRRAVTQPRP
jgi:hypothetical protein